MAYACRILADSISPAGHRLTSWEVTFPRIVLAELNTHCMLSRNSASSRARPVASVIAGVLADPFVPEAFGRNQKGMQPGEALDGMEAHDARVEWNSACEEMISRADKLSKIGVHKQYANRLLEPFAWHTAVVTGTDLDNFFHLRINPAAQGELRKAAELMYAAREDSRPRSVGGADEHDWHTPYVGVTEASSLMAAGVDVVAVSATRCARLSYLTQNDPRDISDELARYASLVESGHMSPLEHPARPMTEFELTRTRMFDVALDDGPIIRIPWGHGEKPVIGHHVIDTVKALSGRPAGRRITFVRGPLHYSGKLNGWISRRAHVPGEHDILGHRSQ